jgi:alpha-L-fucosidase
MDAVDKYDPDRFYTDGTSTEPFSGDHSGSGFKCDAGRRVIAHFYNRALAKHGQLDTLALIKFQPSNPAVGMTSEVSVPRDIQGNQPWIGENPIGDWYYGPNYHYAAVNLVRSLLEYASRGGNYACAVPVTPEGDLEPACREMLADMGAWMKINGEGIYGSTGWKKWGEGPGEVFSGKLSVETAAMKYSTADFRFTQGKDGSVFAWCLMVPAAGKELKLQSLGQNAKFLDHPIKSVTLLGSAEKIAWRQEADALFIRCPANMPFHHAVGFRVGF